MANNKQKIIDTVMYYLEHGYIIEPYDKKTWDVVMRIVKYMRPEWELDTHGHMYMLFNNNKLVSSWELDPVDRVKKRYEFSSGIAWEVLHYIDTHPRNINENDKLLGM